MPQHRFRLFDDLAFLQSLDKPGILSRFLAKYRSYFTRHGLDIDALRNDDDCARQLLEAFTRPDSMPGDLLRDLYLLEAVADEDGHERILEEAERLGIDLQSIPSDVCCGDFAILVFLKDSRLIRICHEKAIAKRVKRYYEYPSEDEQRFNLADVQAAANTCKATLGRWFEERKRTRKCETFVYQEKGEIRILITHGSLFRSDGNITNSLELSRLGWRPQKHDSIIYDMRTGILKVHAQFEPERQIYREALGQALASNAGYFVAGPCYTLEPLRSNGGVLFLVDGVDRARLTEVIVETDSADCDQIRFRGNDLTAMVCGTGTLPFPAGEIVLGRFALHYTSGGRARKLEMRLPNVADYDRNRDGAPTEAFIRANGFPVSDAER